MTQKTNQIPVINQAGYDLLKEHILRPSAVSTVKPYEQLLTDEIKRHIMACIELQFKVQA